MQTKLHGDDVPVPVLAPGNGKTKTARLWTYVRDDRPAGSGDAPAVWFAYSPDRKSEHPAKHLRDFRGSLQADGYAGFNRLYEHSAVTEVAMVGRMFGGSSTSCTKPTNRRLQKKHCIGSPRSTESKKRFAADRPMIGGVFATNAQSR